MVVGRIEALFAGKPKALTLADGSRMRSAVRKSALDGRQPVGPDGLSGDGSQERMHHLPEMALHLFSADRYAEFERRTGRTLPPPVFGENLRSSGATEDDLCIGDLVQIGTARLRVSQPTIRCMKLARNIGEPRLLEWINELGFCGLYLGVEREGEIGAGDEITLIERLHEAFTITRLHRAMFDDETPASESESILALPDLGPRWRHSFRKRVAARR